MRERARRAACALSLCALVACGGSGDGVGDAGGDAASDAGRDATSGDASGDSPAADAGSDAAVDDAGGDAMLADAGDDATLPDAGDDAAIADAGDDALLADAAPECTSDPDCDDGDACNGTEACAASVCVSGAPPTCAPPDACSTGTCDASLGGCVFTLVDADGDGHASSALGPCGDDCDDTRADVYTGATELCDAVDQDCDGDPTPVVAPTWYCDGDADSYAAAGAAGVMACAEPAPSPTCAAWTAREPRGAEIDCADGVADAFPGQTAYFDAGYPDGVGRDHWDYDCDGDEDLRYPLRGRCVVATDGTCSARQGFVATTPPACGAMGDFVQRCSATCVPVLQRDVVQPCN